MSGSVMKQLVIALAATCTLNFIGVTAAEARAYEPQRHWWTSGQICAAFRDPPGRRAEAFPPAPCSDPRAAVTDASASPTLVLASAHERLARPKSAHARKASLPPAKR